MLNSHVNCWILQRTTTTKYDDKVTSSGKGEKENEPWGNMRVIGHVQILHVVEVNIKLDSECCQNV